MSLCAENIPILNDDIGYKTLYGDSGTWDDYDDYCHGDPEHLNDDPDYVDGFMWSCCEGEMDSSGCVKTRHAL